MRNALREIRNAIDDYKDASTAGKIEVKLGTDGYPESLKQLVDGVKLLQSADGKKIIFLRRIPKDPMTDTYDWGMRSTQDDPDAQELGRPKCFRSLHQEHGACARWNTVFRVVTDSASR